MVTLIFFAFRAPVVGGDTFNYVRYLTGEKDYYNLDPRPLEDGFIMYREFVNCITDSRFAVMIINTLITLPPVLYMINKYSRNVPLSVLLFFYLQCTVVYFCALRQMIGLSIIFVGLLYYLNRIESTGNKVFDLKGLIFLSVSIFFSFFFHTSSVVSGALILLLLPITIKYKLIYYALIIISLIANLFGFFDPLEFFAKILQQDISVIERLNDYMENDETTEGYDFSHLIRLPLLGLITVYFMDKDKINHIFVKLFILGIVVQNLFNTVEIFVRLFAVYNIFGCICFTWIFGKKYAVSYKFRRYVNIVSLCVVLFYTLISFNRLTRWNPWDNERMHPYYFIFQDYSDHPSYKFAR
ncbi:MAG: EpsG family protein [Prevotella sp.]|nr:EpsG family protein [Prevotella sp.]